MTGSMLLGHGAQTCAKKMAGYCSALQLLHHHFEYVYSYLFGADRRTISCTIMMSLMQEVQ